MPRVQQQVVPVDWHENNPAPVSVDTDEARNIEMDKLAVLAARLILKEFVGRGERSAMVGEAGSGPFGESPDPAVDAEIGSGCLVARPDAGGEVESPPPSPPASSPGGGQDE
jgi:hypothetical protein